MAKGKSQEKTQEKKQEQVGEGVAARGEVPRFTGVEDGSGNGRRAVSARGRSDDADAFLPDPDGGPAFSTDDFAEFRGEDFLRAATTGEDVEDESLDQVVPEELGGPFLETAASDEFAMGSDASNPEGTTPEPLPRAIHGLADRPRS